MNRSISIVLVEPENPDNIGAAARAMKNMGLCDLRLVRPPRRWKERGRKLAMSAKDVLYDAAVFKNVRDAVKDTQLVIGTTRRNGPKRGYRLDFAAAVEKIKTTGVPIALLFGKESKGLSNAHLSVCDFVTTIPADRVYPSINLAQAVMIVAFSLFSGMKTGDSTVREKRVLQYVSKEEMDSVLARFREALTALNYEREGPGVHERIVATLHRLFKRNGLIASEAHMLKGLSRRITERLRKN